MSGQKLTTGSPAFMLLNTSMGLFGIMQSRLIPAAAMTFLISSDSDPGALSWPSRLTKRFRSELPPPSLKFRKGLPGS